LFRHSRRGRCDESARSAERKQEKLGILMRLLDELVKEFAGEMWIVHILTYPPLAQARAAIITP
jgi:hypothetical protein